MKQGSSASTGQATTEYILLLIFVVILFITIVKGGLVPILQRLQSNLTNRIDQSLSGEGLYRLPFKP